MALLFAVDQFIGSINSFLNIFHLSAKVLLIYVSISALRFIFGRDFTASFWLVASNAQNLILINVHMQFIIMMVT